MKNRNFNFKTTIHEGSGGGAFLHVPADIKAVYGKGLPKVNTMKSQRTYVALLRGINVGGKNKVAMSLLREYFSEAGFTNVRTYINSGNVIFESDISDKLKLIQICNNLMIEKFSLSVPVTVISAEELANALLHAPKWWDKPSEEETVHQAIFIIPPITAQAIITAVGEPNPQFEQVDYYENVIFWSAARETFSKTRWSKIASSSVYSKVTIRNANTSKKLCSLASRIV